MGFQAKGIRVKVSQSDSSQRREGLAQRGLEFHPVDISFFFKNIL